MFLSCTGYMGILYLDLLVHLPRTWAIFLISGLFSLSLQPLWPLCYLSAYGLSLPTL